MNTIQFHLTHKYWAYDMLTKKLFNEIKQIMYLGPYNAGQFGQIGGVSQSAQIGQFWLLVCYPVWNQNSKWV